MPTILHVEDDPSLAEVVKLAFESFGFRGTMLQAATVATAAALLDERARRGARVDLILSDMMLPDGTGLDLARQARKDPRWERTPILILSADPDAARTGPAYALGADSYVITQSRDRSLGQVMKTLYEHWLRDVVLPRAPPLDRAHLYLAKAAEIRARHAALFMKMAEQFGETRPEADFWLSRALCESNLVNLLTFLGSQLEQDLPAPLVDEVERAQAGVENALAAAERDVAMRPFASRQEAYRRMLALVSMLDAPAYTRALGHMFPVAPVATGALRDFLAEYLEGLATWGDQHAGEVGLRDETARLHARAARVRALQAGVG